jgi:hypothetical protein
MSALMLLTACSSSRSKSIKSIQFAKKNEAVQSIGFKEFKQCHWAFVILPGTQYEGLEVDQIISANDPKIVAAQNLHIEQSGFGVSSVGRFCVKAKGDFYATK